MSEKITAERLLRLRGMAINEVKSYENQLTQMGKEYKLDIDLNSDLVKYKEYGN